ncbi:pentapeptide repeat-containing protein [Leptolyngbya sp. GGD]|uniref:pentapeptide repeat-containing protein n=1 Tax=Leptolyngbya sp. GGD TaxID=2997907 RepID=UPI00227BE88D|nr:pentapeptide repeat-containing protein [Leptolyngbya sp. GGD]MCY6492142.1 pentapeptide repeat-containing protein [Leptolyngbya sp. GGD]
MFIDSNVMQSSSITNEFFIRPNVDLQIGDEDYLVAVKLSAENLKERWQTPEGRIILERWKANAYQRKTLDNLVGKYYGHTDLRGIDLSAQDLSGADLSNVDLFAANLENAILQNSNLMNSYLSEANIKGTCFNWAKMDDVLIDNVKYSNSTSFIGVRLNKIDFNLSELLQDFAYSQQRIIALKRKYPRLAGFLRITCDYGRSFPLFLTWCSGIILLFSALYCIIPGTLNHSGFWSSFFFSFMTFTSADSGIEAASVVGQGLAMLESALGYLMTGLLVAILVKRTIGD